jgi:hypothetical protein
MFDFFSSLFQSLLNGILGGVNWLASSIGNFFTEFFNGITQFLINLFSPLILFFQGFWYLITSLFNIIVLIVQVILGMLGVLTAIIGGVINTFSELLGFSGSTAYYALPSAYQQGFNAVIGLLGQTGFNTMAYIMAVFVWIATVYAAIKIAGSGGG